jgi:hypothetical protein
MNTSSWKNIGGRGHHPLRDRFKAPNPYFIFCAEMRQNQPEMFHGLTSQEGTKRLAEKWKELGENAKEQYKMKSNILKDERKYQQQMIFQQDDGSIVQLYNPFNVAVLDPYASMKELKKKIPNESSNFYVIPLQNQIHV